MNLSFDYKFFADERFLGNELLCAINGLLAVGSDTKALRIYAKRVHKLF